MIFKHRETSHRLPPLDISESQLPWVAEAARKYTKVTRRPEGQTNFLRGTASIEILQKILPEIGRQPNILLVGLGLDAEPLLCCYVPYRIAAHLEGINVDYQMTLVDVNPEVITDISGRTRLFLTCRQYGGQLRTNLENAWIQYLDDTGQTNNVTFEREAGLNFYPYLQRDVDGFSYRNYLDRGIFVANVSAQFRSKLVDGGIRLILNDVAVADLGDPGQFDFVECVNILYLLTTEGQQLALANIAQSMAAGGRLLINDIGGYTGTPMFRRLGGWLDNKKLKQLGLEVEEITKARQSSQSALLRRVG